MTPSWCGLATPSDPWPGRGAGGRLSCPHWLFIEKQKLNCKLDFQIIWFLPHLLLHLSHLSLFTSSSSLVSGVVTLSWSGQRSSSLFPIPDTSILRLVWYRYRFEWIWYWQNKVKMEWILLLYLLLIFLIQIIITAEREEILDSMLTEYALYAISIITPSHLIF